MTIDLSKINYTFQDKPLVFGGKAMEYYGLRQSGNDIDLIASKEDITNLVKLYPHNLKDLYGDLGVIIDEFEIWKSVVFYNYNYLKQNAVEEDNYLIISLDKLLFQKALAMKNPKYMKDLELITKKIIDNQYLQTAKIQQENRKIIEMLPEVKYLEQRG